MISEAEAARRAELLASNLAVIQRLFPDMHDAIARLPPAGSFIVGSEEAGDLSLDIGHTTLYGTDAASFAQGQIEQFRIRPTRFYMEPPPRRESADQQQYFVSEALYAYFGEREIPAAPPRPTFDGGGYMLVYGVGLGLHLPALFEEAPVRHFTLIDEHLAFFRHTLELIDWVGILDRLAEREQTISFVFGNDPDVVAARVHWQMRGRSFGLIDGSYLYRHYRSTVLDHAYQDFLEKLPLLPISIGYVEDELVMIENCTKNLTRQSFHFLDLKPRVERDVPAVIVGSGPSLDGTLADLRRIRDQVIVFSSGTALLPLLRNGIRPDFQCELENGWGSVHHLQRTAAEFSLDGITLIASSTVHPELPGLFGERIFYFRDSVSSTPLWCPDTFGIHGTAPTCTNLALRAAQVMAFHEIYLFGVDLGTRHAGTHHSKDSVYLDEPEWLKSQETDPNKIMNIPLPGNFGGGAHTNIILHWARMMMAQSIDAFSTAKIFNCSDGASIPGTFPKLARSIRPMQPQARRDIVLARVKRELGVKAAGEMAPTERIGALRRALAEHYQAMQDEITRALDERIDFVTYYERMQPFLARTGPNPFQTVLRAVNIGTVMMCFQIGYYFARRVPADEQPRVTEVFLTALSERFAHMAGVIDELVERLLPPADQAAG